MKVTGKPYAGKPHVRIDEGERRGRVFFSLYSTAPAVAYVLNVLYTLILNMVILSYLVLRNYLPKNMMSL